MLKPKKLIRLLASIKCLLIFIVKRFFNQINACAYQTKILFCINNYYQSRVTLRDSKVYNVQGFLCNACEIMNWNIY